MTRGKLKKICRIIFYINIVLGLAAFIQNISILISSGYAFRPVFDVFFYLGAIAFSSPRLLNAQFKLNYPERAAKMQSENEKPMDIEFLTFLIWPAIATMMLLYCLFAKLLWELWIM